MDSRLVRFILGLASVTFFPAAFLMGLADYAEAHDSPPSKTYAISCIEPFTEGADGRCSFTLDFSAVPSVRCQKNTSSDTFDQFVTCSYDPNRKR